MVGAFGLIEGVMGSNRSRLPADLLVENHPRLSVFALYRCGGLVEGAVTTLQWEGKTCQLARRTPDILIEGGAAPQRITVIWEDPMPQINRPVFLCPVCQRPCRNLHESGGLFACRKCCGYDYSSRHLRRYAPGLGRIERLRKKINANTAPFSELPPDRPQIIAIISICVVHICHATMTLTDSARRFCFHT